MAVISATCVTRTLSQFSDSSAVDSIMEGGPGMISLTPPLLLVLVFVSYLHWHVSLLSGVLSNCVDLGSLETAGRTATEIEVVARATLPAKVTV